MRQQSTASVDLGLRRQSRHPVNIIGDGKLTYEGREWSSMLQLTERAPRDYMSQLSVRLPSGTQADIASTYKMSHRHEFTNDISVTDMQPIRINGHLRPLLENMQARIDVGYEGRTYMADASWMNRGTGRAFNTRASAELDIAGRTAGLSAELNRRNEQFTVNIETKYNQDKRVALSTQITAAPRTPRLTVRLDWPQNFFAVAASGRCEMGTSGEAEGSFRVTSSLPRLEELGASFSHNRKRNGLRSIGEVTWAADRKINAVLTLEQGKATVVMSTPFRGYQSVKVESTYNARGASGTFTSRLQWDGRQIYLLLQGDANQPDRLVTGRAQFASPFRGLASLSANFQHRVSGATRRTNADFSWARGKQVTLSVFCC